MHLIRWFQLRFEPLWCEKQKNVWLLWVFLSFIFSEKFCLFLLLLFIPLSWFARVKSAILKKEETVNNLRKQYEVRYSVLSEPWLVFKRVLSDFLSPVSSFLLCIHENTWLALTNQTAPHVTFTMETHFLILSLFDWQFKKNKKTNVCKKQMLIV